MDENTIDSKLFLDSLTFADAAWNPSLSVAHSSTNERLNIFPNPVSDILKINNSLGKDSKITIFDLTGKVVMKSNLVLIPVKMRFPMSFLEIVGQRKSVNLSPVKRLEQFFMERWSGALEL